MSRRGMVGTIVLQNSRVLLFPGITGEDGCFRDTMSLVVPGYLSETVLYPGVSSASALLTSLPLAADFAISRIAIGGHDERFVLIGYSYGGNLAFEVAHRMKQRGFTVDLLVLIDPALPNTSFSIFDDTPAQDVDRTSVGECPLTYALRPVRLALSVLALAMPNRMRRKLRRRILYELRIQARRNWTPVPIGTQTLHIASGQLAPVVTAGWGVLCPWIRQVFVAGSHVDILRMPKRTEVAEAILAALNGACAAPALPALAADIPLREARA